LFHYRKVLGPKGEEEGEGWRKLHTEELDDLQPSLNIISIIKSRMGPVADVGRR
jgi:hypothetical protein